MMMEKIKLTISTQGCYEIKKNMCVYICVKIITILNVLSKITYVTIFFYFNIPRLEFMDIYFSKFKFTMYCPKYIIKLCVCNIKKLFNLGFTVCRSPSQF
jgi:hypothetical protein